MKNNYILVDYENVQNIDLNSIKGKNFYIKIFVGTNQTKIPVELVLKSQELGSQVEWIQINGSGKNALDFHITFVLGRLTQKDADAFFHIISKDTGFDPLIAYLKSQKILCKRSEDIPLIMESNSTPPTTQSKNSISEEHLKIVFQKLTSIDKKSRPKSEAKLKNHIKSILCLKELTPTVDEIYQQLLNSKKIYFNQAKQIEYAF
ncbi:PIN domain-containing protein [Pseudanabaena minima]|uniref:PIN domain-containing protein n=1 Tax=Pseudanabaena minima TaxID=890415 RepID=UPI003DA912B2